MTVTIDTIRRVLRALAQAQRHPHKARAFQTAAQALEGFTTEELEVMSPEQILALPGVGNSSYRVIMELLETGRSTRYEKEVGLPIECDLLQLRGVGVKTAQKIIQQYGVTTVAQLEEAVRQGRITDTRLVRAVTQWARYKERLPWYKAHGVVTWLRTLLHPIAYLVPCGSYRRLQSSVGDLDFIVPPGAVEAVRRRLRNKRWTEESSGPRKVSGTLTWQGHSIHVDFLEVPESELWCAVNYLTGSKAFNIFLRQQARSKGLKLNEKALTSGRETIPVESEHHLFALLDLPYVPPEAREEGTWEEIRRVPDWRRVNTLDFHVHSRFSDGASTVTYLAKFPTVRGISDHSQPHPAGVDHVGYYASTVREHGLLVGLEVEVLSGGRIKVSDDDLRKLDYVILSAHYNNSAILETASLIKHLVSLGLPVVLGHLSGRKVGFREGVSSSDLKSFLNEISVYKDMVIIEVNAQPDRLDPPCSVLRHATKLGFGVLISSDFHRGNKSLVRWLHHLGQRRALRGLVQKEHLKKAIRTLFRKGGK